MTKNQKKVPSFLGSVFDEKGPKTLQGKANKMCTGDGRKKFKNLPPEEQFDCAFGSGSVVKNKKKSTKDKH